MFQWNFIKCQDLFEYQFKYSQMFQCQVCFQCQTGPDWNWFLVWELWAFRAAHSNWLHNIQCCENKIAQIFFSSFVYLSQSNISGHQIPGIITVRLAQSKHHINTTCLIISIRLNGIKKQHMNIRNPEQMCNKQTEIYYSEKGLHGHF